MKTSNQKIVPCRCAWIQHIGLGILVVAISSPLFAALGGSLDSVSDDRDSMKASMKITDSASYTVYEIKAPSGTVVREYASPAGRIFGVAWEGPFVPDMRQVLGSYFEHYSESAKAQRDSYIGRRPLNIKEPGLVVQTAGHMRAYSGRAYDPGLLPAGVSADAVR